MRLSRVFVITLCLCLLGGLALAAQSGTPAFTNTDCPFPLPMDEVEGETVDCGYLTVPENRSDPNSAEVDIAVAIIHSHHDNPPADPVIYLEGGPGGSALAYADEWFNTALRTQRDVIIFDQRGTGYSEPSLNCPEMDEELHASSEEDTGLITCRDRLLDEGIDLTAYNTVENAADVRDLAAALGYEQVNLYGVSYGTRLALIALRDHPDIIRSAVIDAVYPPQVAGYEEQAQNAQRAFEVLFNNCAADPACNAAYPNLREVFFETVTELEENPALVYDWSIDDEYELYGHDFVDGLFLLLYDTSVLPFIPLMIYDASIGNFDVYIDQGIYDDYGTDQLWEQIMMAYLEIDNVDQLYAYMDSLSDEEYGAIQDEAFEALASPYTDDDSEGMFHSVECIEEMPQNTLDRIQSLSRSIPDAIRTPALIDAEESLAICNLWAVPAAPQDAVISDLPVLVLSGEYDPITPPEWGTLAAETLSNSYEFTFPGIGHGALDAGKCPNAIILAFLANPLTGPDATCIMEMPGVEFYVR